VLTRVIELAARIALVTEKSAGPDLVDEAKAVYANQDLTAAKFQHLCLTLETAVRDPGRLGGVLRGNRELGPTTRPGHATRRGQVLR
jgi:hypothetical protein